MLKLAKDLILPTTAITQTFAFIGKRGGGKSYAASKLAELMLEAGAQIIALDPVGVWYGLRVPKKENEKAFEIVVFGGMNGDIEIHPKAGKIIAELIIERNLSAVIDFSHFIQSEQTRFAYDFLTTVFELKKKSPSPVHLFLEEAQEIVPQNIVKTPGENYAGRVLHAGERMVKLGRNFGIGCSLISQRPQEVNKKVLNQTEVMLAFQMTGIQERKTIAEWTQNKGSREEMVNNLPSLEVGEALVWSPSWLKFDGKVKILPKKTADVSATPQLGDVAPEAARKLAPVDVEELASEISKLSENAEKESPKNLKKKILELEKQLANKGNNIPENIQTSLDEKQSELESREWELFERENQLKNLDQEIFSRIKVVFAEANKLIEERFDSLKTELAGIFKLPESGQVLADMDKPLSNDQVILGFMDKKPVQETAKMNKPLPLPQIPVPATQKIKDDFLNRAQRKILDTLATFEQLGLSSVDKTNVAVFSGASPKSSAFTGNLSFLRNSSNSQKFGNLIDYTGDGSIKLTSAGRELARPAMNINTLADLHDAWCHYLSGKQAAMLRYLLQFDCGQRIPRTLVAQDTNQSVNSSAWTANLSALRKLGLIDYAEEKGMKCVYLTNLLFPVL